MAWVRLSQIIGQSTILEEFKLMDSVVMASLCSGLPQNNHSIKILKLSGVNLQDHANMILCNKAALRRILLSECTIGSASINILTTTTISNQSQGTLIDLDLSNDSFGKVDLEELVGTLINYKELALLNLRMAMGLV